MRDVVFLTMYVTGTAQVELFGDLVRQAEMLWTCAEETHWTHWTHWTKNVQHGAARKEESRNIREKVHECWKICRGLVGQLMLGIG